MYKYIILVIVMGSLTKTQLLFTENCIFEILQGKNLPVMIEKQVGKWYYVLVTNDGCSLCQNTKQAVEHLDVSCAGRLDKFCPLSWDLYICRWLMPNNWLNTYERTKQLSPSALSDMLLKCEIVESETVNYLEGKYTFCSHHELIEMSLKYTIIQIIRRMNYYGTHNGDESDIYIHMICMC